MDFGIPQKKKKRVILDTDAKNEVDDQFAIVHALLTPSFDLRGIIPAHFGTRKSSTSMEDSRKEIDLLLDLMGIAERVHLANGAVRALPDENTPVDSPGARLIIEEALKDDPAPLYIAFLGPLTDMASALLLCPEIARRNVRVVWIGGRDWPCGGKEYNLSNDVFAANVVFKSSVQVWQIPRNVYRMMPVSYAELWTKVHPHGKIGAYLTENVIRFNNGDPDISRPAEYRILGDSPAIGVMLYEDCGEWEWRPAPDLDANMRYLHDGKNRPIRVYKNIDSRFILEDFYAKLQMFSRKE